MMDEFYLIWNPNGHAPTYRHMRRSDAMREAERLANVAPGETFIVMEAICACRKNSVTWEGCGSHLPPDDEIPFWFRPDGAGK